FFLLTALVGYYLFYIIVLVVGRYIYMRYWGREANDEEEEQQYETGGSASKLADIESDAKSIKSAHHYDPPSRKGSTTSHGSATSAASQRKRVYSYEDGIVLTSRSFGAVNA